MDHRTNPTFRSPRRSRSLLLRRAAGACSGALASRAGLEHLESRTLLAAGPVGGEFLVNTYTTDYQASPAIAMDSAGNFVIAWTSNGQDGSGCGVYAQRYSAAGVPQGSEFRANTYPTGDQRYAAVAMDSAGDFVIAWQSSDQDGSGAGVYAQRYSAAGAPQGLEFRVNTSTTGDQEFPAIAMDSAGSFVIAWDSRSLDGTTDRVYAQRYSAAGAPQGGEFLVNTCTTGFQSHPAIAMDSAGDFVITWQSNGQDGHAEGIYAQRYSAAGVPQGGEFRVNTYTTANQARSAVAMDGAGGFVVAWGSDGQDGGGYGVYAQRYSAPGVAQGGEFRVNTYTADHQSAPDIAMDAGGSFVIAWESNGQDGNGYGVYAQRYSAAGVPQDSEFRVSTYTTGGQYHSAIGIDSVGDFVVAWQSDGQDGSSSGIYAQRHDATPPKALLGFAAHVIIAGGTSYDFTVVYSDNSAMDVGTLGSGDIRVVAPNGLSGEAQFLSCTPAGNGTPRTATYRFIPPGGSWDAADAGQYLIALQANQVADIAGNYAAAATLGSFKADFAAPTAKLKKLAKVKRGKWPFKFTVTYRDDVALNALTIGPRDIFIAGPRGFKQYAKFKSKTLISAGVYTAVYEIAPPKKKWDAADNGSYTIWLNANHVLDAAGKAARKTKLGVLKVKC